MMMVDFEIHMTTKDVTEEAIHRFESFCQSIQAKPIIIELSKGKYYRQPMISKVVKCEDKITLEHHIAKLRSEFLANAYEVTRTKIEVQVKHRKLVHEFYEKETQTYYEWHGKVQLTNEILIRQICEPYNARLSRNTLKNDSTTKFITIREYDNENHFNTRIEQLKEKLSSHDINFLKEEYEYCIFDSNERLDRDWIN